MILPSVFVEIPTQSANLVPLKASTAGRSDEIKAEPPIKSEIDHANQQSHTIGAGKISKDSSLVSRPLPSPTPSPSPSISPSTSSTTTTSSSSTSSSISSPATSSTLKTFSSPPTASNLTANLVTARPKRVKCFKCEQCPFMSISQDGYNNHIQTVHSSERNNESATNRSFRNKMLCPGCENVFYSKMSLKIHLVNDHQMSRSEICQLLESLFAKKNTRKCVSTSSATSSNNVTTSTATSMSATTAMTSAITSLSQSCDKGTEKQKIYLKNVEVLQKPRFNSCEFSVETTTTPPTILSPSETPSECSSNLTDDIANTDVSIIDQLTFNRMPNVRQTFNQLDNNCLYQHITINEPTPFPLVSATQSMRNDCMNLNDTRDCMPLNAISPIIEMTSIDDTITNRPDSGSSVKFSENFLNSDNIWPTNTTAASNTDFSYQTHINLNQLPSIRMSTDNFNLNVNATESNLNQTTSIISSASIPVTEKKKIYIKNIDILKEPLIKPTHTVNSTDSNYRKNTLHLRTVDEVNLLIKPHESNSFNSGDGGVALNEDEYRYVLNDASEYNNIIPQYLETDVNDFMFSNEPQITSNPVEYYNGGGNSNYAITNLDANAPNYPSTNNTNNTFESVMYENPDRSICNGILGNIPNTDLFPMNHNSINLNGPASSGDYLEHDDGNHFFGNKYIPMKGLDMIVSSEEIVDILDLTNDEVEQILDDTFNSPRLTQPIQPCNRVPRINFATNLTLKAPSPLLANEYEGKTIDMRSLETPTINLESAAMHDTQTDIVETSKLASEVHGCSAAAKKKSGRTKGARQINGISNRNNVVTTKCSISNCGMRFATRAAILLHEQCHSPDNKEIRCPKCEIDVETSTTSAPPPPPSTLVSIVSSANQTDNNDSSINISAKPMASNRNWNWNTLHTHLWREHNIDMELYSCPHCSFKTPILSRLKNTHMKIHSDTRDFKCDFCAKAFKNARQMKNHRRIHTRSTPPIISQCKYCGQSFYSAKHLKEHYYTHSDALEHHQRPPIALQCNICTETFTTKHALRTHHLNHFDAKRFNCTECDYKSNDHNAFRRHQMVHRKEMKYKCPCCAFQCIQSTNYRNHILKNHADSAKELMFMCDKCNFVTVNKRMYDMHCLNHNNNQMSSVELD